MSTNIHLVYFFTQNTLQQIVTKMMLIEPGGLGHFDTELYPSPLIIYTQCGDINSITLTRKPSPRSHYA